MDKKTIEVTQEILEQALLCCAKDEPAEKYPCEDCYLYPLSKDGQMSTGETCFKHLALDTISYIRRINDFEKSQCAKLLQKLEEERMENGQLRAVVEQIDPDFFKKKCRVCGCDWNHPCNNHDFWVEDDLCSACAEQGLGGKR